jgi:hypothetical protein
MIEVKEKVSTLEEGIANLIKASKEDFIQWSTRLAKLRGKEELSKHSKYEIANFYMQVSTGIKYIKLIRNNSVHSFIVKEDSDKFKKGDILMPSSWSKPAKNQARGNVLTGFLIEWTGPLYLNTEKFR